MTEADFVATEARAKYTEAAAQMRGLWTTELEHVNGTIRMLETQMDHCAHPALIIEAAYVAAVEAAIRLYHAALIEHVIQTSEWDEDETEA